MSNLTQAKPHYLQKCKLEEFDSIIFAPPMHYTLMTRFNKLVKLNGSFGGVGQLTGD
jgi:hypothetical protein